MDAALVGMASNADVGNAHGHPHRSALLGAFAYHLQNPDFVGVGNGETFAFGGIAVSLYEGGHHVDGFAGRARALQGDGHEADVVDDAFRVGQLFAATESGFGDGHLMFVDVAHDGIGEGGFGNFAMVYMGVAVDDAAHGAGGVLGGRQIEKPAEHTVIILVVGDECRAVGGGFLAYQETGAGLGGGGEAEGCEAGGSKVFQKFHREKGKRWNNG